MPLKNLYGSGAARLGALRRDTDGAIVPTVYPSPIVNAEAFPDGARSLPFDSLEELVRAGWVVD